MQDIDIIIDEVIEEEEEPTVRSRFYSKIPIIGRISYFVFLITVLLLPIFVLPASWGFQMEFTKKLLFSSGVLLSFGLWLVTKLEDGRLEFPGGSIFWSSLLIVVSFLTSSLLSSSIDTSLLGLGYENDTFASVVIFFIAMFLASIFFDSKRTINHLYKGLIASASVAGVIELFQVFSSSKLLSGGVLDNLIGKWNDLGIFFGLALLLSLVALELKPFEGRVMRKILWVLSGISVLVVAIVNYDLIWGILGLFSLIIFIYSLAEDGIFRREGGFEGVSHMLSRPSFAVLVLSILFFFGTNIVGSTLGKYGIYQLEVRPSWQSTVEVAKATMNKNLFFGSGPNTFSTEWSLSKPEAVNSTVFWNTDFSVGFGRIPSFAVTLGLLGLIASGLFMLAMIYNGHRAFLASFDDLSDQFILVMSAVASFYLWSFSLFYVTDTTLLALTFVFTGIFLGSLSTAGLIRTYRFSFFDNARVGFISVLMIVIMIIAVISGGYLTYRKFGALYNFQQGLYNFNNSGNLDQAEASIKRAIDMDGQDLYYRSLTEIYLIRLRNILNGPSGLSQAELMKQLQDNLTAAAGSARKATEINSGNYLNWLTLGKVGETVLPLKDVIAGSYDLASQSYLKALALNPNNPTIYLSLAQLEAARGNVSKAKEYIAQALTKKSNFTAALFLASQIEASQGNLKNAIAKAQEAAVFSPGDIGVLFQLGLLKYMSKDYTGSIEALGSAVSSQPNYSNAKYFLGLSYSKLGKTSSAIKEFEDIIALNPDSKEVQSILKNLRAGRGALENITPPKNEPKEPEKRSKLPVKDSDGRGR